MSHSNLAHRRTHNLLLISKLLNQRDNASPFTLVQDTLEQPAKPLVREYFRRAKLSRTNSIFLSFETFKQSTDIDSFILCHNKNPQQIAQACAAALGRGAATKRQLILIDSMSILVALSTKPGSDLNLSSYLSSLLQPPRQSPETRISLVAVYHTDVVFDTPSTPYSPSPLSLLLYLATTIIIVHSLPILLTEKAARDRSLGAPAFGLAEEAEGILIGLKPYTKSLKAPDRGIVLELEHRRKSGRGVHEWYFLPAIVKQASTPQAFKESVVLLDDHPLFRKAKEEMSEEELAGLTFELGLTERQRLERDGVVLPYFDAQKDSGPSEGGRILYEMGVEDDFDEEEDEI